MQGIIDTVVVVAAGTGPPLHGLPADAPVIAADGGLARAQRLGLRVTTIVGDLDSVDAAALGTAEAEGVTVERHPVAKDATDLELALDAALALRPRRVVVVASAEGRLDHLGALLLQLGASPLAPVHVDAYVGDALVHVIRGERTLAGSEGELVTLLALHGAAHGVTTQGLAYPLRDETLAAGSTRGVSNVFTGVTARVTVADGVLLALRPAPTHGGNA